MGNRIRHTGVDSFRVIMIIGVIFMHVRQDTISASVIGDFFWPFAVPFFFITSLYYLNSSLRASKKIIFKDIMKKSFFRLCVPYLVWTSIYMTLHLLNQFVTGHRNEISVEQFVFGGSAVHLYFIPKLLLMMYFTISLYILRLNSYKGLLSFFLIITIISTYSYFGILIKCFWLDYAENFIGIPIYCLVAYLLTRILTITIISKYAFFLGLLICLVAYCLYFSKYNVSFFDFSFLPLCCGLGSFLVAFGLNDLLKIPSSIASSSFGIYLSHIVFLEIGELAIRKFSIPFEFNALNKIFFVLFVFSISLLFVLAIRKNKVSKTLFFGE